MQQAMKAETAMTTPTMPVLFLGHGSPMNAIEDNAWHQSWVALGQRLPRPKAILVVSAHWETRGIYVTAADAPETIHDFYGFPKALFDVRYRAPGSPALARRVQELITTHRVHLDAGRGLDHGSWGVVAPMYPEADIPVVQLSIDTAEPGSYHYAIGKQLAPLREEGVLVIASGDVVHNLGLFNFHATQPYPWAAQFQHTVNQLIARGEHATLCNYLDMGQAARLAIPTPEHYFPLLYALALQQPGEDVQIFNDEVMASLSMTSLLIAA
jgi:4,5-DOPA dioxygenase extradiol